MLSRGPDGRLAYGFIHGDWALDNSHPGGLQCGVNDEITVLRHTGCYADFTMPSVFYDSQSRLVNRVYFAVDDPQRPASHLTGPLATAGQTPPDGGLLMIPGPLALNWRSRVKGVLPRIDSSAIDYRTPPSLERFTRWLATGVAVTGRPEWVFIKAHTHGAPEANAAVMLGGAFRQMLSEALARFNDGTRYRLHFVTAREMANIAFAAIDGHGRATPDTSGTIAICRSRRLEALRLPVSQGHSSQRRVQPELRMRFGLGHGRPANCEQVRASGLVEPAEIAEGSAISGLTSHLLGHLGEGGGAAHRVGQDVWFGSEHLTNPLARLHEFAPLLIFGERRQHRMRHRVRSNRHAGVLHLARRFPRHEEIAA